MHCAVLWDIDHTLIENHGVSKEIYAAAYSKVTGEPAIHRARTEGRTDRLIMRDLFLDHDQDPPAWTVVERALEAAGAEHLTRLQRRGVALPGALDALRALAGREDIIQSVLTGNVLANAKVKLHAFELDQYIDWDLGGYGADADDRSDLVEIARQRILGAHPTSQGIPIVLIGDTPRDVQAAIDGEAAIIAVATGEDSTEALARAGAAHVLTDLSDTSRLMVLIDQLAGGSPGTS